MYTIHLFFQRFRFRALSGLQPIRLIRGGLPLIAGSLLLTLASCKKDQYAATPATASLAQNIRQDPNLSLFRLALTRAGLDSILNGGGPWTVFAPVDSAMRSAGFTADSIGKTDPARLNNIISYHIAAGRIGSGSLTGFIADSLQSLNKQYKPIVEQNFYGIFLNGIRVIQANIASGDGVLHKLGSVALPPTGNLLQALDSLPNTKMAAWIFHNSHGLIQFAVNPAPLFFRTPGSYQLWGSVPGFYNSITLLIPSDAAFALYGYNSVSDLARVDTVSRTSMVANCVLFGSLFTSDFLGGANAGNTNPRPGRAAIGGYTPNMLSMVWVPLKGRVKTQNLYNNSGTYEFSNDGLSLMGYGVAIPPRLIQTNIVTTNGVIHIIDQVFEPQDIYSPGGPGNN